MTCRRIQRIMAGIVALFGLSGSLSASEGDPYGLSNLPGELARIGGIALASGAACATATMFWPHQPIEVLPTVEELSKLRRFQPLEFRLMSGDTLAGSFLGWLEQPDRAYAQALDSTFAARGLPPLPISLGADVLVPGKYRAGRRIPGSFQGFAGEGFVVRYDTRSGPAQVVCEFSRTTDLETSSGERVDLLPWIQAPLPSRVTVLFVSEGTEHRLRADEIRTMLADGAPADRWGRAVFSFLVGAVVGPILLR